MLWQCNEMVNYQTILLNRQTSEQGFMLARVENNHAPIAYVSTNVVNLLPCVGAVRQKAAHNTWHTPDYRVQQYRTTACMQQT